MQHIRRSLRFRMVGSALILTIPAIYGLVADLSHRILAPGAAIVYVSVSFTGLLTAILLAYQTHVLLTRSLQIVGAALKQLGHGRATRIRETSLPSELRGLAQASNATSDTLTSQLHELHDQSRRTALLTRLAIDLRAALDPAAIVHGMLMLIGLQSDACDAAIMLIGPDGAIELAYATAAGEPRPMAPEQARRELEQGPAGRVWRGAGVVLTNDIHDPCWGGAGDSRPAGSLMALPLAHCQATFGVLTISHPLPGHFTSRDLLLFEAIAAQASVALSAARLRLEQRCGRDQALLLWMGQSLAAERPAELLERSAAAFDASGAALFLAGQDSPDLRCFASHMLPPTECGAHAEQIPTHMAAAAERAWQAGEPTSAPLPDDASAGQSQDRDGLTCVALPLRHAGEAIGVFTLACRARGAAVFSADTWAMLAAFGNMLAGVFAHARPICERAAELPHSCDPMRVIFDHLPDGLVLIGAEGRILIANDAFCEDVLGLPPRAAIGQHYATIIQELERDQQLTVELHPSPSAARRARCAVGQERQRWYQIDRFVVASGGDKQVIERWHDVTRQEEQHRELLRDEQISTMARLAASVVHDIGNPLQSVRSCIDLSREDTTLAAPAAEYLELASSELRRMSEILGRLRDLHRLPLSEANDE